MLSLFQFSRRGVLCRVLGFSALVALLFVAGCGTKSTPSQPSPVLTITKTHTGSFTQGQQSAAYTVTVANTGTAATTGTVTVTETVPSGLTLVSMAGTGWTCTTNTCTRTDALAASASYPTITVTVNVAAAATSPQVNQISVSGGGAATANGQDSTTIIVPVLSITKTHTGTFAQGQQGATYTVTVSNAAGTAPTNGTTVTVTDTVPSGLTLVSMSGSGWTCPSAGTTCTRSDVLQPGSSYPTISVTVNVGASATSPQVNTVTVSGGGSANANANDSTTIITSSLSITKSHSGNFAQGQVGATYTVTVSNAAGAAPTNGTTVTVVDTVPGGLTLTNIAGAGWTCVVATATCTRTDALAAASSYPPITVTVNVGTSASSPQVNNVSVSGGGSASANASDSTVIIAPSLSLTKSHTGNFAQGQTGATYTVTVSNSNAANTGPTNGTPVTVTDTAPSGLAITAMSGTGWTCVLTPTDNCTRTDVLAAGTSYPGIAVTVNVAANATTPQVNQVSVSGGGSANANASDSTTIDEPALSISKTHIGNFTQGQTNATYTVTVSNTGTLPTSGTVTVTDSVPSGETLVTMAGTGWTCPGAGGANTCDRSDALASSSNYPTITVTVNVGANASSPQVNNVSASGGGSATANGSDSTTITSTDPCATAGTGSESLLNGQYDLLLKGFDNGLGTGETTAEPGLIGGVLAFNGTNSNGLITSGVIDMNLNSGVQSNLAVTAGSYKIGSDHRACMTITTSAGTQHYRGSLGNITSNVASTGHIIGFDTAGPFTTGILRKQSSTVPTTLSGSFAFGVSSAQNTASCPTSVCGGSFGAVGVVNFTSAGAFTISEDFNQNGQLDGSSSNTTWPATPISITGGVYSISANGRGTFTFTPPGTGSTAVHAVIYVVSSSDILILGSDPQASNALFAGEALLQSGTPFAANPLSGAYIGYQSGLGSTAGTSRVALLLLNASGTGITGNQLRNDGGSFQSKSLTGITYSVAPSGRMTIPAGGSNNNPPIFYLVSSSQAFFLGGGGGTTVDTGFFQSQTATAGSGTYAFGTVDPQDASLSDNSGVASFASPNISVTEDDNSNGSQNAGQTQSFTFSVDSTGLGGIPSGCTISSTSTTCSTVFYVISPTKAVVMDTGTTQPKAQVADQ